MGLKAIYFGIIAFLGSAGSALYLPGAFDGTANITNLVVLGVGAIVVALKKNTATQPWAKFAIAAATAGAAVLTSAWSDHLITAEEWSQIVLAFLGATVVGAVDDRLPQSGALAD